MPSPRRYAVVTGSLGVGNVGDDALLAAFLARHGHRYRGITVLTHAHVEQLPGRRFLSRDELDRLPERLQLLKVPRWDLRGLQRDLIDRLLTQVAIGSSAAGAAIDYVWLGGLLGVRPHMRARLRELAWANQFIDRFVYYFGDAEFKRSDDDVASRLFDAMRARKHFIAIRSDEGAALLRDLRPTAEVHVGTDIVIDRYARGALLERQPARPARLVVNVIGVKPEASWSWLECGRSGVERGMAIDWLSFSDRDDLTLCRELAERARRDFGGEHRVVEAGAALEALQQAEACVATRYHCHIFALTMGLPVLSIPFAFKSARLVRELGLESWELSEGRSPSQLLDRLDSYPNHYRERLASMTEPHERVARLFDASLVE